MCACPRKAFCLTVDLLIVSVLFLTAGGEQGAQSGQRDKKFAPGAGPFLGRRPVAALCYRSAGLTGESDEVRKAFQLQ